MSLGIPKARRYESRAFLTFAKEQGGYCCLCWPMNEPADELHHWGEKGMGQKGHDYEVARLCRKCHERMQGKRKHYFCRTADYETLAAMQEDSLELLMAWTADLEGRKEKKR